MHFSVRKITAATLAALLAALACFEHALHDVSHVHVGQASCLSGKLEAGPTHDCCSHGNGTSESPATDDSTPTEHDPGNCAVCRFLALPQLFETPRDFFSADKLVTDMVAAAQPSFARRIVTVVSIRGPPVTQLARST